MSTQVPREISHSAITPTLYMALELSKKYWKLAFSDGEEKRLVTVKAKHLLELFGWRKFTNRRELASLVGLTPMPYNSGDSRVEQGISKTGSRRVRALLLEISWLWLRYQGDSELSRWFNRRFAAGGKRMRRIGIVALARKLLIALWRYLETGEIPAGATLKAI